MIGLLDLGNSRYKWARLGPDGPAEPAQGDYGADPVQAVAALLARQPGLARLYVASVRGAAYDQALAKALLERLGLEACFVRPQARAGGLDIAYDDPSRLGVDRYLAMRAACARWRGPLLVVDCGTAVTLDAVDGGGRHLGGLILPGLNAMRAGLRLSAAGLAGVRGEAEELPLFARDTDTAVGSGVVRALVAAIDRVSEQMAAAMGGEPQRVLTGGDAPRLQPLLAHRYYSEPLLVLKGLALVAEHDQCVSSS